MTKDRSVRRFTIRDGMWFMVVAGMAFGWDLHDGAWKRYHNDALRITRLSDKISAMEKSHAPPAVYSPAK